eukprot:Lankesteria_metandrocarpae@DN5363_c0_g1_i1.p1
MITYKQDSLLGHDILFRLWGSVLPYAWFRATFSASVCFFLLYYNAFESVAGGGLMYHPNPFTFYFQIAALVLAFHTNQAYNRFWEARTQLQSMAAYWGDAAAHVLAFDRCKGAPQELLCPGFIEEAEDPPRRTEDYSAFIRRVAWQAKMVHLFSLLHAVSLSYLLNSKKDNVEIEVLGGVSRAEHHELAVTNDHSFLVAYWITEEVTNEHVMGAGGLAVPPPILSRTYQLFNNGNVAFNQACKIEDTPFPFPYIQLLHVMNLCVLVMTPIVMACWISNIPLACIFTWLAVGAFHSLFAAAGLMESPFGTRPNDLPLIQLNSEFIKRLIAIVTPNVAKYLEEAGQMHAAQSLSRTNSALPEVTVDLVRSESTDNRKCSKILVAGKTVHFAPHLGVSSSQRPSCCLTELPLPFKVTPSPALSDSGANTPRMVLSNDVALVAHSPSSPISPVSVTTSSRSQRFSPENDNLKRAQTLSPVATSLYTPEAAQEPIRAESAGLSTKRWRLVPSGTVDLSGNAASSSSVGGGTSTYPHLLQQVSMDSTAKRRLAAEPKPKTQKHEATPFPRPRQG